MTTGNLKARQPTAEEQPYMGPNERFVMVEPKSGWPFANTTRVWGQPTEGEMRRRIEKAEQIRSTIHQRRRKQVDAYLRSLHAGQWGRSFEITSEAGRDRAIDYIIATIEGVMAEAKPGMGWYSG